MATTIDKSFTATGAGDSLSVAHGDFFTYSVSGTFVGTVLLEKSENAGASWSTVTSKTAAATGTVEVESSSRSSVSYRFRCSAFTSGTIVTSIADGAKTLVEYVNKDGETIFKVTEAAVSTMVRTSQKIIMPAAGRALPGATAGWRSNSVDKFRAATFTTTFPNCTLSGCLREESDGIRGRVTGLMSDAATSATVLRITMPTGYTIDTSADKLTDAPTQVPVGRARLFDSGTGVHYGEVRQATSTAVDVEVAGVSVTETAPFTWASGDRFGIDFFVPCTQLAGVNTSLVTLPASRTSATLVVPLYGLKVGQTITGFHLVGQVESAGGTVTLDAALRKHTAAAADVSDASVGSMTQLALTADAILSASNTAATGLTEVVGADEHFYILITGTTAASTDVALQGIAVTVTEA